jgi:prevent-host-death family protein
MTRRTVTQTRQELPEILNRASNSGKRFVVSRRGRDVAAIVPIEDLRLLEELKEAAADRQDLRDAKAALAELGSNVSWDRIKAKLRL